MQYTFRQQHFSGLIWHRLDYIFISHNFKEMVEDSEILYAIDFINQGSAAHLILIHSFINWSK